MREVVEFYKRNSVNRRIAGDSKAASRGKAFSKAPLTSRFSRRAVAGDRALPWAQRHHRQPLYRCQHVFGEGTYPTDGMRRLLREALLRLSGDNASLETAFGGG